MSNMVVRTNIFSLNAHRNMKNVGLEQRMASNRLSSGYRINSAADDAAGLAISETMRAQIRGLDQASSNAQDAQAMMLTTEGGLNEIGNAIHRVRELLVQAANDTNTNDQREMINQEIIQLGKEITSAQQRVEFNTSRVLAMGQPIDAEIARGISVLDVDNIRVSAASSMLDRNRFEAQEALNMLDNISPGTSLNDLGMREIGILNNALRIITFDANAIGNGLVPDVVPPNSTLAPTGTALINHAMGTHVTPFNVTPHLELDSSLPTPFSFPIDPSVVDLYASDARQALISRIDQIDNIFDGLANIRSAMSLNGQCLFNEIDNFRGEDTSGNFVAFFQAGPNSMQGITFDFEDLSRVVSAAAAVVNTVKSLVANPDSGSGVGRGIEVSPLLAELSTAVEEISAVRAGLGAVQNRLDHTMRSLDISSENLQDSESRVRNADMAREMMRFTMSNVLQQASISMLSQANQLPNNLLQILQS